jgi:hypothetical protein
MLVSGCQKGGRRQSITWKSRGKCTRFWRESLKERGHSEDQKCRWENGIRMDLTKIGWGSADWIRVTYDRDRWRAVVNAMKNL